MQTRLGLGRLNVLILCPTGLHLPLALGMIHVFQAIKEALCIYVCWASSGTLLEIMVNKLQIEMNSKSKFTFSGGGRKLCEIAK